MQGKVDRIWHNHRPDGSEYWVLSISGKRYSTWDKKLVADIHEGDSVDFAFTDSGRYRNLTGIKRVEPSGFTTADRLLVSPESLRIVRMNCMRTAAEMLKDTTWLPQQKLSLALDMARKMERHILGPYESSEPEQDAENDKSVQAESEDGKEGSA